MARVNDHPLYDTWANMIQRCTNPKKVDFKNWGGRGITVCDRWREPRGNGFRNFVADLGERPSGYTLDRRDNNGNYDPGNCRWATRQEQTLNSRYRDGLKKAVATHAAKMRALTHCKRGHEYTPENTYTYKGNRSCKACKTAWERFLYYGKMRPIEEFLYPAGKPGRPKPLHAGVADKC